MKEHVIYLEPGDDVHSTLDKLSWVKSSRVLIVWPDKGHPLATRFELTRLVRYAQQRGIHMGVVAFDPEVRANARTLGVPLFSSLEHRPEKNWTSSSLHSVRNDHSILNQQVKGAARAASAKELVSFPEQPQSISDPHGWSRKPAVRVLSVFLMSCAILALAVFIFPSARVYLSPETSTKEAAFELLYNIESQQLTPAGIPAAMKEFSFTVDDHFLTTGSTEAPDQSAGGAVSFYNYTQDLLIIPAGTGLTNGDGIRFVTIREVVLEPLEDSESVPVEAVVPGEGGNVGADEIQWIEGDLGLAAAVSNPEALSGGTSIRVRGASEMDFQSARQDLMSRIADEMHRLAPNYMEQGEIMVPGSLNVVEAVEGDSDVEIGEPAEGFHLSMSVVARFAVVDESQLQQYARELTFGEPDSAPILVPGSLEISLSPLPDEQRDEDIYPVEFRLRYRTAEPVDFQDLQSTLAGRSIQEAAVDLQTAHQLTAIPIVHSSPIWFPMFPFVPSRIQVLWVWEVP